MKVSKMMFAMAVCAAISLAGGSLSAQEAGHEGHDHAGHDHDGHDHGDHAHRGETLAFYLPEWKSMHFDDANKAAQHAATVKKLGCEVKQDSHDGHTDVTYRIAQWKEMEVKDHKMAEQWAGWLSKSGFDVSHAHPDPAYAKGPEVVEFRMVKWKRMHGDGSANEKQMIDTLKKVGAEVRVDSHDGHSDIAFRAPTWRDVHVANHKTADQLMGWLKQNGFETRHEYGDHDH
ncbi:hypothetical protein NZK35_06590 [Stieleria sp. ICT_E10.1]|uniref:Secreted protein n=1 Tax=Stieleria magnilauensis TaxID=2527963 RepID=A0ABX5XTJ2_9BACT|nr:hypothetical protein [Stieleria sedimenti]MCS7466342.1 hypothetical protein [Stieleria sedimenti]QDV85333.1 hypothetical protein TBK1r_43120 [Planctomycetes bacterium TBK1r]